MQVGNRFQAIKTIEGPENSIIREDYSRVFGNAIIEKAAKDLRICMKRDKRNRKFSSSAGDKYGPVNTAQIAYFFSSPLSKLCCGDIDPWYIVKNIALERNYPYMEELKQEYERGNNS